MDKDLKKLFFFFWIEEVLFLKIFESGNMFISKCEIWKTLLTKIFYVKLNRNASYHFNGPLLVICSICSICIKLVLQISALILILSTK